MKLVGKELREEEPIVVMLSKMVSLQQDLTHIPERGDWVYVVTEEPSRRIIVKYLIVKANLGKKRKVTVEFKDTLMLLNIENSIENKKTVKIGEFGDKTKFGLHYIVIRPSVEHLVSIMSRKLEVYHTEIIAHLGRFNRMHPLVREDMYMSLLRLYSILIDRKIYKDRSFHLIPNKHKWFSELRKAFGYEEDDVSKYFTGIWEGYYTYGITVKEIANKLEVKI